MRISFQNGAVFSYVFLAIVCVSHAFVFWIPVWKTHSVLRYSPKKGWTPVRTRGSGILKPKHTHSFYSPSHHHPYRHLLKKPHHFYSTIDNKYHHPKHHLSHPHNLHRGYKWRPFKSPLLNLNHHHPLCPLCHVAEYWNKPRKPYHPHKGHHFFGGHPKSGAHFSPSNIFPRFNQAFAKIKNPFFKHHHPHPHHHPLSHQSSPAGPGPDFFGPGPAHKFPKFGDFPRPNFPKSMGDFAPGKYSKGSSSSEGYRDYPQKSHRYQDDYNYDYPTKSYRYPKKQTSYSQSSSSSSGNYPGKIKNYSPKEISYSPENLPISYAPEISSISQAPEGLAISHSPEGFPLRHLPEAVPIHQTPEILPISPLEVIPISSPENIAPPQESSRPMEPEERPKDFSNFFGGFGSGQKGHGWEGWDW